jgi:Tol biopolymer transport system component
MALVLATAACTTRESLDESFGEVAGESGFPALAANGSYLAFASAADDVVAGDTNGVSDVFVRDRTGTPAFTARRVSVASDGTEANGPSRRPSISDDGRRVAFVSEATNLVAGDTNGTADAFVHDLATGTTTRVSVATGGTQADGETYPEVAISRDGTTVAFASDALNLVPGLVAEVTRVFVRRIDTATTEVVSVPDGGGEPDGDCGEPAVSADGRFVAFVCDAANLVPGDTNDVPDVFRRDRQTGRTQRVSLGEGDVEPDGPSGEPAISQNGLLIAFASAATNLLNPQSGDHNDSWDVFARLQPAPSP